MLQAVAAVREAGAAWRRLGARQGQTAGEQESQRQESRAQGLRESHSAPLSRHGRTEPALTSL